MLFSTYHSRVDWRSRVRTIRNRVEMSKASPEFLGIPGSNGPYQFLFERSQTYA